MSINKHDVEKVANLAKLIISDKEIDMYAKQLNHILEHINKLNELNTENVQPTSHILQAGNIFRKDKPQNSFSNKVPLDSAPLSEYKHYKVPKIIE